MALKSGEVWSDDQNRRVLTQWLGNKEWALLSTPSQCEKTPGTEMIPIQRRGLGCIWYHPDPLEAWLVDHGWKRTEITVVENL